MHHVRQVVQKHSKADSRVRVEAADGVVGKVRQASQQGTTDLWWQRGEEVTSIVFRGVL